MNTQTATEAKLQVRHTSLELPGKDMITPLVHPLSRRVIFWRPTYLAASDWIEHIPFAYWLVEAHHPRVFVELGTHYGVSYFAFCQAVEKLELNTRCFAVDTWRGDEHTGFYDEHVFEQVKAFNEAQYSGFSHLVRSTFDDALTQFSDGSIDLLHIDGLHTFEAASHNFESWLPKLSERAVVVLHETNVRERNHGVFRLFETLRKKYPAFEFIHGHGLCVLKVGPRQTDQMLRLFQSAKEEQAKHAVQEVFSRLGRSCADSFVLAQQKGHIRKFKNQADQKQELLKEVKRSLEKSKTAHNERTEELSDTISKLQTQIKQHVAENGQLSERNTLLWENHTELKQELNRLQARLEDSLMGISQRDEKLDLLEQTISENKQQLRTTAKELQERDLAIASLQDDIAAQTVENHSLNDKFAGSAEEIKNLNQALSESRKALASTQHSHQKQSEEIARLQEERNSQLEEIGRLQWYLRERDAEIERLQWYLGERDAEIERLQWYLGERDAEITQLNETLSMKEQKLDQVQSNLVERNETVERLEQEVKTHKTDLMARQEEASTLQDQLEEHDAEIAQLNETLLEKDQNLNQVQSHMDGRNQTIEHLEQTVKTQVAQQDKETAKLVQRLGEMDAVLSVAKKDLMTQKEEALALRKQLEERSSASLRLEKEYKEREQKLAEARDKQAKVSSERQAQLEKVQQALRKQELANKESSQENELLTLQLHQVQEELETVFLQKQRLEQINQNWKVANKEAALTDEQLKGYTLECQDLHRQLLAKDKKIESQRQRITRLKKTISWRLTSPFRAITKPFKAIDKKQKKLKKEIKLLRKSGVFDEAWYFAEYEDVANSGMDPIEHYLCYGAEEGRCPSPTFDTQSYLESNPDVAAAGTNPLVHFAKSGKKESRKTLSNKGIEDAQELPIITENKAA